MSEVSALRLDPSAYEPHVFHRCARDWLESNCYVDLYVEVLHALHLEVPACLSFTLSSDFEGDQWTFFKPPLAELKRLYGLDVHELTLWRPLVEHVVEQLGRGRIVSPEVDSFYLPDTAATDYRKNHVKTSVAIVRIDPAAKRLGYFHNAGYYELGGDDYDGLFGDRSPETLPPYCELLKIDRLLRRPPEVLRELALGYAREQLGFLPENPVAAFGARLTQDVEWLVTQDEATYHRYVFAGLRQCGANFEFAAFFLDWLGEGSALELKEPAERFRDISRIAKMLILKLARISRSKKVRDLSADIAEMAAAWEQGMAALRAQLGA